MTTTHYRTCPLCEATCGLAITTRGREVVEIRGDKDDVFSRGYICPKAYAMKDLDADPDRLRTPMVREGDRWRAASWDEPELRFLHLRPMGSSEGGIWRGRVRHGSGQHFMGTGPLYMAASALFRATRPPYVVGGLGMAWGWLKSALRGAPRYEDREFRAFLRRYQRACLLRGKRRATAELDTVQEAIWRERAHSSHRSAPARTRT